MMEVKKIPTEEFYPTYSKWMAAHDFPVVPQDVLPKLTFVCYDGVLPLCAMPFFHTDSKIAVIAFMVSNKTASSRKKQGSKEFLLTDIIKYAKKKKYLSLYSPTTSAQVIESLLNTGFVQGDEDSSQYFKNLR